VLAAVCDLEIPRMDGMRTIEAFRKQHPTIPVIVLTASLDMARAIALIRQGIADYLLKPFAPATLTEAVQRVIHESKICGNRYSPAAIHVDDLQPVEP
jgi:DNA-binding NtrC family response regulator